MVSLSNPVSFFEPDAGVFEKIRGNHEHRPQQKILAEGIFETLEKRRILIAEAGTGVGKTLSYLIPLLSRSILRNERVLVSTETRALQDQILNGELPLLKKILEKPIRAEICFGSSNYLCKRKLEKTLAEGRIEPAMARVLDRFQEWVERDSEGILFRYRGTLTAGFREKVSRDSLDCAGPRCKFFSECFYFQARERWKAANLLVVNHSLLAIHFLTERGILPEFGGMVVDEAHRFPDIYLNASRATISFSDILNLIRQTDNSTKALEALGRFQLDFGNLNPLFPGQSVRLKESIWLPSGEEFLQEVIHLRDGIAEDVREAEGLYSAEDFGEEFLDEDSLKKAALLKKINESIDVLKSLFAGPDGNRVHWMRQSADDSLRNIEFNVGDMDGGPSIREKILGRDSGLVFASATLTGPENDPFGYFKREIGAVMLPESRLFTIRLKSPFPYEKNALLWIARGGPDPSGDEHGFHRQVAVQVGELVEMSRGGAFILFTSIRSLKDVKEKLSRIRPDLNQRIISQVDLGPARALDEFRSRKDLVLFGLSTFWQGIDVPGDALRLVVLVRIPFRPPGDPVLDARIEKEKKEGRNPFALLQLPQAAISIKQGFGRLIRTGTDRGAIAILDNRITARSYGRALLSSLPPAKQVGDLEALKREFQLLFPVL